MDDILVTFITVTLLILLLVAGIFITLIISSRERLQQQMALADARLAFERELRSVETEVTESIMNQFARELHDNIGQMLTALHIQMENLKLDHPQLAESINPSEIYISEISQQLRMLSRTLNNDYIGHIGLSGALQVEANRLSSLKRFQVKYEAEDGATDLSKDQELMVFRIFQEISQNVLRHARAANMKIKMSTSGGFRLEVRDDGEGFDADKIMRSEKASGLRNIVRRAELAGLLLKIESSPGKGSLFIIEKRNNLA